MSKRSPFWHPFATHTPLGYQVAGHFNTEPGLNYGTIRVTHVDGLLPRPYTSPPIPDLLQVPCTPASIQPHISDATVDLRAVERLDGTVIGFYPLFDGDGALVEVVARTRDSVVVTETPWRPLATLVAQARHAGIEEAVRRQRGVFVFQLVGAANARLVGYPFRLRFVLQTVLRGTGRTLATYAQMRGWANQYGLDLPVTYAEFEPHTPAAEQASAVDALLRQVEATARETPLGGWSSSGSVLWASERAAATLLDMPASLPVALPDGISPIILWDAMARLADRGSIPTRERVLSAVLPDLADAERSSRMAAIEPEWEYWALAYPQAFRAAEDARIAV